MNDSFSRFKGPLIDAEFLGIFAIVGQTIEDRYGNPIRVDTDINGTTFTKAIVGPMADIKQGYNTFEWKYNPAQYTRE